MTTGETSLRLAQPICPPLRSGTGASSRFLTASGDSPPLRRASMASYKSETIASMWRKSSGDAPVTCPATSCSARANRGMRASSIVTTPRFLSSSLAPLNSGFTQGRNAKRSALARFTTRFRFGCPITRKIPRSATPRILLITATTSSPFCSSSTRSGP